MSREVVKPEVLPAVPRSGMLATPAGQPWTLILCGYCEMHGVTAYHDIDNCDEDYGDRWTPTT